MEAVMRKLTILAAVLAAIAVPGAASAVTCYTVVDHSDTTIYQDSEPPFDMSDLGAADREGMRARHEFMMVYESEHCPPVSAPPGTTAYRAATVEEIVAGIREYARTTGGGATSSAGRGGRAAAPSAPARSSSSSARKY
jgi:hypothetical protein